MRGIGGLLIVYGILSSLLYFIDYELTILSWGTDMQPMLGLGIGGVGVVIVVLSLALQRNKPEQPAGPQPVAYEPPIVQAQPAQPYGSPPPLPRRVPHQPFAQQPPREMPPQGPPPPRGPRPPQYRPSSGPHSPPGGPAPFGPGGQFGQHR